MLLVNIFGLVAKFMKEHSKMVSQMVLAKWYIQRYVQRMRKKIFLTKSRFDLLGLNFAINFTGLIITIMIKCQQRTLFGSEFGK